MYRESGKEFIGRSPLKRTRRTVVGASLVGSELPGKVGEGVEAVRVIEELLIFTMAALDLAVVARRIRTNQLVPDAKVGRRGLKERGFCFVSPREAVRKLETVVRLDAFDAHPFPGKNAHDLFQEIGRGIRRLCRISPQDVIAGVFINGGVLEQAKVGIGDASPWNNLDVDLDAFSGMGHLLVGFDLVRPFSRLGRKHSFPAHDAIQALNGAGITAFPHPIPQLRDAELWISPAHIADER